MAANEDSHFGIAGFCNLGVGSHEAGHIALLIHPKQ